MKALLITAALSAALLAAPQFAHADPIEFYLEIAGVTGADAAPNHPDIIHLLSYTLGENELNAVKLSDAATPQLLLATANGIHFPTASLLLYDTPIPGPQPDNIIVFTDVLFSSYQVIPQTEPVDQFTLTFATATPEPTALTLLALPATLLLLRRRAAFYARPS